VHVQRLTGSFADAGLVTGSYAIAVGLGSPVLGRLADRGRQTAVLLISAGAASGLLLVAGSLPRHSSVALLLALAVGIGFATPPVAACLRSRLPFLLPDPDELGRAYALETSIVELCWVCGPPLVLVIGAVWSTGGALALSGVILVTATVWFAAQPSMRSVRPPSLVRQRGGALATARMRILTVLLFGVGLLLGSDEVAVTAAAGRIEGSTAAAAPLLALWGVGSFAGGLALSRVRGERGAGMLVLLLLALTVGHLALVPAARAVVPLALVLFVAGGAIAPTEATVNAMVEDATPAGTSAEAFAWLGGAIAVGGAVGAAVAGDAVMRFGALGAFWLGAAAGALTTLTAAVSRHVLAGDPKPSHENDEVCRATS
jgi:predicted MFS family arabinose efflux permease